MYYVDYQMSLSLLVVPYAPQKIIKNKCLALIFNILVLFLYSFFTILLKIVCIICDQLFVIRVTNPYITFMHSDRLLQNE